MEYRFCLSPADQEVLTSQVARCLDKRLELASRQKLPGLWQTIDNRGTPNPAKRSKVMPVILLCLGIFLLVPGLLHPKEMWMALIGGIIGVSAGISGLLPKGQKHIKEAKRFLQNTQGGDGLQVIFTENTMLLPDQEVPYDEISAVLVTEDLYFVLFGNRAVALQKRDLQNPSEHEFHEFLEQNLTVVNA